MTLRAMIVDDEPLSRQRLRGLLRGSPDVEVVAEAGDGRQAIELIRHHAPDLLFLDIAMPEVDGFGVLEAVAEEEVPAVIFVTAYEEHALRAFEVHAVDYLLKPFDRERFQRALGQARVKLERRRSDDVSRRLEALLEDFEGRDRYHQRIPIKSAGRVYFLDVASIEWIDAAGNYVRFNSGGDTHLLRETIGTMEGRLDPARFVRIHRSTIVNLNFVQEIQPHFHGEQVVVMKSGRRLTVSRSYRHLLEERLEGASS